MTRVSTMHRSFRFPWIRRVPTPYLHRACTEPAPSLHQRGADCAIDRALLERGAAASERAYKDLMERKWAGPDVQAG